MTASFFSPFEDILSRPIGAPDNDLTGITSSSEPVVLRSHLIRTILNKKERLFLKIPVLILIGIISVVIIVLGVANVANGSSPQEVVVTEYQGIKLDDLGAFRENSIKGVQYVNIEEYFLKIGGLAENPYILTYSELQDLQHIQKLVILHCVEGWTAKMLWEGIPLVELIDRAEPDDKVTNVIFKSTDGYTTSLTLDYIRERNIMLADKLNGIELPPAQGFPFIVVAEDKWGYKWARWVEEIELSGNDKYRGYWEEYGYSKDGSLDKPMFDR